MAAPLPLFSTASLSLSGMTSGSALVEAGCHCTRDAGVGMMAVGCDIAPVASSIVEWRIAAGVAQAGKRAT